MDGRWVATLLDHEVQRFGAGGLDVRAGRVEVRVRRNDLAGPGNDTEQDLLRRATLVGWDDVLERKEVLDALQEAVPGRRAGVRLVASLDPGPLLGGHGARAGIGEQVDQHIGGVQVEEVVPGRLQALLTLIDRRHPDRLDALDPERLDDRAPALHAPPMVADGTGPPGSGAAAQPRCMMRR